MRKKATRLKTIWVVYRDFCHEACPDWLACPIKKDLLEELKDCKRQKKYCEHCKDCVISEPVKFVLEK